MTPRGLVRHGARLLVICTAMLPVTAQNLPPMECLEMEGGVTYVGGMVETTHEPKSTHCCGHCCEAKPSGADAWSWTMDGWCQCHVREHITKVKTVGGNARAGHCVHQAGDLPFVPADVDRKMYVTTGDSRIIVEHNRYASHKCSYPNDPTTRTDVEQTAAKNETGSSRYVFVDCDSCGNPFQIDANTARFCQANFAGTGNFSVRVVEYDQGGYCTDPTRGAKESIENYTFGKEHGTFIGVDGPEACSAEEPLQTCQSHSSRYQHCDCDPTTCMDLNGNLGCCSWVGNETLSAVFTYWTLEAKNSSSA